MRYLYILKTLTICCLAACSKAEEHPTEKLLGTSAVEGFTELKGYAETCTILKRYAIQLTYQDIDYALEIYSNKGCAEKNLIQKARLEAEALVLGEWNRFLIFDSGTGSSEHTLKVYDPVENKMALEIEILGQPIFQKDEIELYVLHEDLSADSNNCAANIEDFQAWKETGINAIVAKPYTLDINAKMAPKEGPSKCFAIE